MLSRAVRTEIEIHATAEKVWGVFFNWGAYPNWNPCIKSIEGDAAVGSKLKVSVQLPGRSPNSFNPTLLTVDPNKELRWQGRLLLPGLFTGEHYFIIEELAPDRVKFVHGEDFYGVLVPLVGGLMASVEQGFADMNAKLKELAEST